MDCSRFLKGFWTRLMVLYMETAKAVTWNSLSRLSLGARAACIGDSSRGLGTCILLCLPSQSSTCAVLYKDQSSRGSTYPVNRRGEHVGNDSVCFTEVDPWLTRKECTSLLHVGIQQVVCRTKAAETHHIQQLGRLKCFSATLQICQGLIDVCGQRELVQVLACRQPYKVRIIDSNIAKLVRTSNCMLGLPDEREAHQSSP